MTNGDEITDGTAVFNICSYKDTSQNITAVIPQFHIIVCDSDGDGITDNIEEEQGRFGIIIS